MLIFSKLANDDSSMHFMKMIILRAELMGLLFMLINDNVNVQQCRRALQGKFVKLHNYDLI